MGRIDESKGTMTYFCTKTCSNNLYIKTTLPVCKQHLEEFVLILQLIHWGATYDLRENLGEFKTWMLCLKMIRDMQAFYQAIVNNKSEYELHELRLFALHTDGLLLEEVHTRSTTMNVVLRLRTQMERINISILGNR